AARRNGRAREARAGAGPGARNHTRVRRARTLAGLVKAVVLREPGRGVTVEEDEVDPPQAAEVLVRVAAAGVCHSDVRLADGELGDGRWPLVLGHEGAGVVEAAGEDVTHVAPGDHVAFALVPACGSCRACRSGRRSLCEPA